MKYIDTWLSGLGLDYIIPKLKLNGITTPKKLATLSLRDMFDYGIEDPEDRRKLYFLIQRLQTILTSRIDEEAVLSQSKPESTEFIDIDKQENRTEDQEEDLKILRQKYRKSKPVDTKVTQLQNQENIENHTLPSTIEPVIIPADKLLQLVTTSSTSLSAKLENEINHHKVINREKETVNITTKKSKTKVPSIRVPIDDMLLENKINLLLESDISSKKIKSNSVVESINLPEISPRQQKDSKTSSRHNEKNNSYNNGSGGISLIKVENTNSNSNKSLDKKSDTQSEKLLIKQSNNSIHLLSNNDEKSSRNSIKPLPPPPLPTPTLSVIDKKPSDANVLVPEIADMAIRVVVRKRPISTTELSRGDYDILDIDDNGTVLVHEPKTKVDLTKVIETQKFVFDDAFEASDSNESIYSRTIGHLVPFVFEGGKASCFAYGQTGSGKTFTMMGSDPNAPASVKENAGLYVLAANDVFRLLKNSEYRNMEVFLSCFEIYGGKLFDLLNERATIKCLEDSKQQVQLPGLTEHAVANAEDLLNLMAKAHTQRSTGATGANATSSRSHQVLQIAIKEEKKDLTQAYSSLNKRRSVLKPQTVLVQRGKLSFIDLAGSERGADTNHASKQTRLEGAEINTSLLALKEVIRSLERKHGHTPFRGSKLTQVLKDSFVGEKTRTCMIACVSPSHSNCEHTLNTLRYADRVKEHNRTSNEIINNDEKSRSTSPLNDQSPVSPSRSNNRPATTGNIESTYPIVDPNRPNSGQIRTQTASIQNKQLIRNDSPDISEQEVSLHKGRQSLVSQSFSRLANQVPTSRIPSRRISTGISSGSNLSLNHPPPSIPRREISSRSPYSNSSNTEDQQSGLNNTPRSHTLVDSSNSNKSSITSIATVKGTVAKESASPVKLGISEKGTRPISASSKTNGKIQIPVDDSMSKQKVPEKNIKDKTSKLLQSHKSSIAVMVEVMKREMELVQEMESAENRDAEKYINQLEELLSSKYDAVSLLRDQISDFQSLKNK